MRRLFVLKVTTVRYFSVRDRGTAEFTEKRSHFIATCQPVKTEGEALDFISSLRSRFWDASHNCYAYILRSGVQRYSDDGEPQGTAGVPMLEVLKKEELTDVAVVATRYFGGILLGGGGLARAYSRTATIGISAAVKIPLEECLLLRISCDYSLFNKFQSSITELGGGVDVSEFTDKIVIHFHFPEEKLEGLIERLSNIAGKEIIFEKEGKDFFEC